MMQFLFLKTTESANDFISTSKELCRAPYFEHMYVWRYVTSAL